MSPRGRAAAEAAGGPFVAVEVLSEDGDPVAVAARLFDALHDLQASRATRIVAEPFSEAGLGHAVMDRLRRAAANVEPAPAAEAPPAARAGEPRP